MLRTKTKKSSASGDDFQGTVTFGTNAKVESALAISAALIAGVQDMYYLPWEVFVVWRSSKEDELQECVTTLSHCHSIWRAQCPR